ncbi:MAG TPA: TonB-dependent receptor [Vicinamibacterales bacterium]|nr:TonB-dependent receptor [Vicinamibacterales bacterium]
MTRTWLLALAVATVPVTALGQPVAVSGRVVDETGGALPGVTVRIASANRQTARDTTTDAAGRYQFAGLPAGQYDLTFSEMNFADARRRGVVVTAGAPLEVDVTMHLSLSAEVVVTAASTFRNLADLDHPEEDLVGVATAASEGAVTGRQIQTRPIMRSGEVLETVPGLIISQHSGEGKANQYYLRGFNLDHGTDFATTVAGLPVNLPTNAHGQGYSDTNFLIPELVTGVQFKKGPYAADEGDFSAAGAANVNYASVLDHAIFNVSVGEEGWSRVLVAASPAVGAGHVLAALELNHNDGPWVHPDDYGKVNGVVRYTRGTTQNAFSITGLAYAGSWNSTDQVPQRAITEGSIGRFGAIDPTDGGSTARYSLIGDYQRTTADSLTHVTGFLSRYRLNLFSNFTYFLDDPVHGDQFEQADRRWVSGGRVTYKRQARWGRYLGENQFGVQLRNDDIPIVGLYHTAARTRLSTTREDAVTQSSAGVFVENAMRWTPWLRTTVGLRADGYRFDVTADNPLNSGTRTDGLVSPKGGVVVGPWRGTEFYANAGTGFHSNDARGATITRDPSTGETVNPVTPLVRAKGAEVGVRTVALPHVQTTLTLWRLDLASELVFAGDAGTTEAGRPSERDGIEWTNYVRLSPVLTADADLAWSHARFTDADPVGNEIPGAVQTVASLGLTADTPRRAFGSVRFRYFGPRPLIEDNSVRSAATGLLNAQVGYHVTPKVHLILDMFNLLDANASDIDYFYESRLPGEPLEGIADIHSHPTLPRTARFVLRVQF